MRSSTAMRTMRALFMMGLIVHGLLVGSAEAASRFERESLRGLTEVFVMVDVSTSDAERDGVSEQAIRTAVEAILRSSGIRVLTVEEGRTGRPAAILNVNADAVQSNPASVYGFNVTAVLYQQVRLANRPEVDTPAITWGKSITGAVHSTSLKPHVMRDAESIAKAFANDFLSMNTR
ncbi:MAG: hypothetical protein QM706_09455 [Nitrospira sp.]